MKIIRCWVRIKRMDEFNYIISIYELEFSRTLFLNSWNTYRTLRRSVWSRGLTWNRWQCEAVWRVCRSETPMHQVIHRRRWLNMGPSRKCKRWSKRGSWRRSSSRNSVEQLKFVVFNVPYVFGWENICLVRTHRKSLKLRVFSGST